MIKDNKTPKYSSANNSEILDKRANDAFSEIRFRPERNEEEICSQLESPYEDHSKSRVASADVNDDAPTETATRGMLSRLETESTFESELREEIAAKRPSLVTQSDISNNSTMTSGNSGQWYRVSDDEMCIRQVMQDLLDNVIQDTDYYGANVKNCSSNVSEIRTYNDSDADANQMTDDFGFLNVNQEVEDIDIIDGHTDHSHALDEDGMDIKKDVGHIKDYIMNDHHIDSPKAIGIHVSSHRDSENNLPVTIGPTNNEPAIHNSVVDNGEINNLVSDVNYVNDDVEENEEAAAYVPFDNLPPVAAFDSGFHSERNASVISDYRSLQNGALVTSQNCPICRKRREFGTLTVNQQWQLYEVDEDNDTLLHLAIMFGEVHLAKCLMEQTPTPECVNIQNNNYLLTPLHLAVLTKHPDLIRYLLAHGADLEMRDRDGNTPLHVACENIVSVDDMIVIKALIVPLSNGLENFKHANVHTIPQNTTLKNYSGKSVLHLALEKENLNAILFLVGPYFKVDVNIQESTAGYTILHQVVHKRNYNLLKELLLIPGININALSFSGKTPYDVAHCGGDRRLVWLLKIYGGYESDIIDESDATDESEV